MKRHRPVAEGARIYNLFPLIAGPFDRWRPHLERACGMGFNWIFINPFHQPGFSGSLYAVKDYYVVNPLFVADNGLPPMEQLRRIVEEARGMGLHLIMDLVINHTAIDSPLLKEHPDWYRRDEKGKIVHPSAWEGDKCVAVWGDLAEIDNECSPDRENLRRYWEDLVLNYHEIGFEGFRCDAAYQVPDALWASLIGKIKGIYPGTLFFAETLGCTIEDVVRLAKAGFDYTFNSSKYWDFEAPWCLDQYAENAQWAPSVSFAESHDTNRLAEELEGNVAAIRQRYLFSALFSTAVMMPIGFEFGFRKRLHVVSTRPSDWEETGIDLTGFITEVNAFKKGHSVFNEDGPIEVIDCGNDRICALRKSTFDRTESALLLLNRDPAKEQAGRIESFPPLFPEGVPFFEAFLGPNTRVLSGFSDFSLPPSGFKIFFSRENV
ncbi:MAG: alpha-amylase [Deltaproteobacteria bacterium]|nr:alpha-amylase [Deltaproteobacteria bacterium]